MQEVYKAKVDAYKNTYKKAEMHKMAKLEEVIEDEIAQDVVLKPVQECCEDFNERVADRAEDMPKQGFNGF